MMVKTERRDPINHDRIDIKELTLKQKAALAHQLVEEVVSEVKNEGVMPYTENNKRIAGIVRVFGDQYVSTARNLKNTMDKMDEEPPGKLTGSVLEEKTINNTSNRSTNRTAFCTPIFIDITTFINF
ncbi:hypothetical protein IMZ31_22010 (plasmid) [Pontibacillus sp. ALD_SL1]|uniref:hypothetical protein n=1 Tax=Pontibacillus sp. ALD_SL1 TaxID=2777185 RepID=UPI001A961320|nr:hypothetical protein [Pontibacillus sp. ALD_SL1]QST02129.1 hypothetical protein IMZ31_22010 [Pontibacillus sp. ALD_SL1]